MTHPEIVLVVGEIIVDFTLSQNESGCKLRLGGVVHAARGLWAAGLEYAIAAFCPEYLVENAKQFLSAHGCKDFHWLGNVVGAPNVIVIGEVTELAHQGYEDLLRDEKQIKWLNPLPDLAEYRRVIVFPGKFELSQLSSLFSPDAQITFDIAYDIDDVSSISEFNGRVQTLIISTSSELFAKHGGDTVDGLIRQSRNVASNFLLLKENRGGSRLFNLQDGSVEEIPATLGHTCNSVGVGDVYSAVMVGLAHLGWVEAAWRGCQAATAYSQTTYPDDLKRDLTRAFKLSLETLRSLGGTALPWHDRQLYSIYLAGPDFSYVEKAELDHALRSLTYHNFKLRRPIIEHGELVRPASEGDLLRTYHRDYELLKGCDAIFAIPLERDPGTLVEIGMAIALGKPVVTYDPRHENNNTMVVAGSSVYSSALDTCLNGMFNVLAELRAAKS